MEINNKETELYSEDTSLYGLVPKPIWVALRAWNVLTLGDLAESNVILSDDNFTTAKKLYAEISDRTGFVLEPLSPKSSIRRLGLDKDYRRLRGPVSGLFKTSEECLRELGITTLGDLMCYSKDDLARLLNCKSKDTDLIAICDAVKKSIDIISERFSAREKTYDSATETKLRSLAQTDVGNSVKNSEPLEQV